MTDRGTDLSNLEELLANVVDAGLKLLVSGAQVKLHGLLDLARAT